MQKAHILLVEGKRAGSDSFAEALKKADFSITLAHTGKSALNLIKKRMSDLDLVVFDASSMRSSGTRTCRRLRKQLGSKPLIHCRPPGVLAEEEDVADVYLEQPFTPRKLINRIRMLLPVDNLEEEVVRCGSIVLYRSRNAISANSQVERHLTPMVVKLLEEFIRHPNKLVTRQQLMRNVWNTEYTGDTRTLDVHIRWVREAIENEPSRPRILTTIRGKGYIFTPPIPNARDT